jgi:hypothetical protein
MTAYLRPLVIAGCYTACVFGVAKGICEVGMNPFEDRAIAAVAAPSPLGTARARAGLGPHGRVSTIAGETR